MSDQFEWDEEKNLINIKKHQISFTEASEIFNYPIITKIDNRYDYNEKREISLGKLNNEIIVVMVHTDRNKKIRIISARKANRNERKIYNNFLGIDYGKN